MSLKVAFQMDPIEASISTPTRLSLAEAAQAGATSCWVYGPDKLRLARRQGAGAARGRRGAAGARRPRLLRRAGGRRPRAMDVVWLRQDPPFDMGYITTTHILEHLPDSTLVANDPFWVRNSPEKLLVLGSRS